MDENDLKLYCAKIKEIGLELVSKELNLLAAILHVYAGGLNFMKYVKNKEYAEYIGHFLLEFFY